MNNLELTYLNRRFSLCFRIKCGFGRQITSSCHWYRYLNTFHYPRTRCKVTLDSLSIGMLCNCQSRRGEFPKYLLRRIIRHFYSITRCIFYNFLFNIISKILNVHYFFHSKHISIQISVSAPPTTTPTTITNTKTNATTTTSSMTNTSEEG